MILTLVGGWLTLCLIFYVVAVAYMLWELVRLPGRLAAKALRAAVTALKAFIACPALAVVRLARRGQVS